jgi:hypothetical protein
MDPDADGPGVRGWLGGISAGHAPPAAFDTRLSGIPALTGRASRGVSGLLKRRGYRLLAGPESFLVGQQATLVEGEAARARAWGAMLGEQALSGFAHA